MRPLASIATAPSLGCATEQVTEPTQTKTDQLAISTAVDEAVDGLSLALPHGAEVSADTSFVGMPGDDKDVVLPKFMVGTGRDLILALWRCFGRRQEGGRHHRRLRLASQSAEPLTTRKLVALFEHDLQRGLEILRQRCTARRRPVDWAAAGDHLERPEHTAGAEWHCGTGSLRRTADRACARLRGDPHQRLALGAERDVLGTCWSPNRPSIVSCRSPPAQPAAGPRPSWSPRPVGAPHQPARQRT